MIPPSPPSGRGLFGHLLRMGIPSPAALRPWGARRVLTLALAIPALIGLQLVHWMGFLLDDVFFRGYRALDVEEPLFVVGLPRSGTSFLQRVLALDERRTTMRLWQLVLAPSIVERKLYGVLARVDRAMGGPGRRSLAWAGNRLMDWMDDVHPVSLTEPEEDFLLLLPGFACFLLVLAFPLHPEIWRLTRIDEWDEPERRRLMAFYRGCLQRHLYAERADGQGDKRLLSKNPSFTGAVLALAETFPDARFVCCVRDPREGVPSQLSAVEDGLALFGTAPDHPEVQDRFVDMMEHYAIRSVRAADELPPDRWVFVRQPDLRSDLVRVVDSMYRGFGWELPDSLRDRVGALAAESCRHSSAHVYSADALGVSREEIGRRFRSFIERFGFDATGTETSSPPVSVRS